MSIDLAAAVRRRKPDKWRAQLKVRSASELTSVGDLAPTGRVVLVADTNVYIDDAAANLPVDVEALLDRGLLFHCSVCLAELATGVANGNPSHPLWTATRKHLRGADRGDP